MGTMMGQQQSSYPGWATAPQPTPPPATIAVAEAAPPVSETSAATSAASDPHDYTDKYNTSLSSEDERKFQAWGKQQAEQGSGGRNPATDTYDYDMRGFWKSGESLSDDGHAGDRFKKPNHPTFSTQSQYHDVDGAKGGVWSGGKNGEPWTFTPSEHNLSITDPDDLQRYFDGPAEGGRSRLVLPKARQRGSK